MSKLFAEISTHLLDQGYLVKFNATGNSMWPTIANGETILVAPIAEGDIKPGDILLYKHAGRPIAHRVVAIKKTSTGEQAFILRGDAAAQDDEPIFGHQITGKVVGVERKGKVCTPAAPSRLRHLTRRIPIRMRSLIGSLKVASAALFIFALIVSMVVNGQVYAQNPAPNCATAGKDGAGGNLTGVVNSYYPGTANAAAGAKTISVGTRAGASTNIATGDLLLVIQMQDATIDTSNDNTYGVGGTTGAGFTNLNSSGLYEYVVATSAVSGGVVNISGKGTGNGLINAYNTAAVSTTQGVRRFQVIRVPQYTTATLTSGLTALAWNGSVGGVLAIDVSGVLTLNSATVSVNGKGFRGGGGIAMDNSGTYLDTDYNRPAPTVTLPITAGNPADGAHSSKGEGIAGSPRYMYDGTQIIDQGENYPTLAQQAGTDPPAGSFARGAPGNAGGGGTDGNPTANDENAGGGGGSNAGGGGRGGNSWSSNLTNGGLGGVALVPTVAKVFLGGGGGAGDTNNGSSETAAGAAQTDPGTGLNSSGAAGGGIVMIRALSVTGTGTITANGNDALNVGRDAGGGGGAGGTIIFLVGTGNLNNLNLQATGGDGGNAWLSQVLGTNGINRHGPGGGGGGGLIVTSNTPASRVVTGGANGVTTQGKDAYGAQPGGVGTTATATFNDIPGTGTGSTCLAKTTGINLIALESFQFGKKVMVRWSTGYESKNLGFHVYREVNGVRERITPSLIAGAAFSVGSERFELNATDSHSYIWIDELASKTGPVSYWLDEIDLSGQVTRYGPVSPRLETGKMPKVYRSALINRLANNGQQYGGAFIPVETDNLAPLAISPAQMQAQYNIVAQPGVKITVTQQGWHVIKASDLIAGGLSATGDPARLQLFVNGIEQAIKVDGVINGRFGTDSTIGFYGVPQDTPYTNKQVYWLIYGGVAGKRITSINSPGAPSAVASFPYTLESKERTIYFAALTQTNRADNFFGAIISPDPATQALTINGLATGSATIEIALQGATGDKDTLVGHKNPTSDSPTAVTHSVNVSLNGTQLGRIQFVNQTTTTQKFTINTGVLREGVNTLTFTATGGDNDISLVDYVRVTYPHNYNVNADRLEFSGQSNQKIQLSGFTTDKIHVIDVSDTATPRELIGTVMAQQGGFSYLLTSPSTRPTSRFVAFTDDSGIKPESLKPTHISKWHEATNQGKEVVITSSEFVGSFESLRAIRNGQGYFLNVIDVQDLYDEFGFGSKSPDAIKTFLSVAQSWRLAPKFVLLAGDASFDPRGYLGLGNFDFVPTKLVSTLYLQTASDDWFVDFNNDSLPELAIGRLPARTAAEMNTMVAKIVSYEQGAANSTAIMVNGRNDGYNFDALTDELATLLPSALNKNVIKRSVVTNIGTARLNLITAMKNGAKVFNYFGHGSVEILEDNLLTSSDASSVANTSKIGLFTSMECLNGYFQDVYTESLAEALMKTPNGGPVAIWASSALTEPSLQSPMNKQLYTLLFTQPTLTIGEAIMRSKSATTDKDVRRSWILFGDPAMRLK